MDPKELDAVAEAIWLAMNIDNKRQSWAEQPENIKFLPRHYARAALLAQAQYRAANQVEKKPTDDRS